MAAVDELPIDNGDRHLIFDFSSEFMRGILIHGLFFSATTELYSTTSLGKQKLSGSNVGAYLARTIPILQYT